jgi:hypothetical protein
VDIVSTDPERPGIFAFGQFAWGIFALGQMASGVIAIGQVATGVIAIGQGAVGIVAIGQGALGVLYAGGMIAVGGRGFGVCLKVLPKIELQRFERPSLPPLSTIEELADAEPGAQMERGWVLAEVKDGELRVDRARAPFELSPEAQVQLQAATEAGHTHACVTVVPERRVLGSEAGYRRAVEQEVVLEARRLASWREASPRVHVEGSMTGPVGLLLRAAGMVGLATAWWLLAGTHVFAMFLE